MIDETAEFWLLLFLTAALCGRTILAGIRDPRRMIEFPFLASLMWAYFYVYMAYQAKTNLGDYLPAEWLPLGQLLPLACFLGLLGGWKVAIRNQPLRRWDVSAWNPTRLWFVGMALLAIGAVGTYSFANAVEAAAEAGERFDWAQTTAYWYYLYYAGYPGAALTVFAIPRLPSTTRWKAIAAFAVLMIVAMIPYVYNARRGPLFPMAVILLMVPPLATGRRPRPFVFLGGLGVTAFLMFAFVQARTLLYTGRGDWSDVVSSLSVRDVVVDRTLQVEDNEYVNNVYMIAALHDDKKFYWGSGHAELLVHWIPRSLWAEKPSLGEGWYSNDELLRDISSRTKINTIGGGASAGGVAETFLNYAYFAPLFWFALSWSFGRLYLNARSGGHPLWLSSYVCSIAAAHWLISQGFAAAFVPAVIFQVSTLAGFTARRQSTRDRGNFSDSALAITSLSIDPLRS